MTSNLGLRFKMLVFVCTVNGIKIFFRISLGKMSWLVVMPTPYRSATRCQSTELILNNSIQSRAFGLRGVTAAELHANIILPGVATPSGKARGGEAQLRHL